MINIYGYSTGVFIACSSIALAIYTGMLYERHTTPRPCIVNLSVTSYPYFEHEQMMLDNIVDYDEDSDFYRAGIKTSEELAERLVEMSQDTNYPSEIYINPRTQEKFYVPGLCYVGDVDFSGDPILYRKGI